MLRPEDPLLEFERSQIQSLRAHWLTRRLELRRPIVKPDGALVRVGWSWRSHLSLFLVELALDTIQLQAGLDAGLHGHAVRGVAQHGLPVHAGLVLLDVAHGRRSR